MNASITSNQEVELERCAIVGQGQIICNILGVTPLVASYLGSARYN
jgi:hypothetical protein